MPDLNRGIVLFAKMILLEPEYLMEVNKEYLTLEDGKTTPLKHEIGNEKLNYLIFNEKDGTILSFSESCCQNFGLKPIDPKSEGLNMRELFPEFKITALKQSKM